ncbi:MAG: hypothetical protein HC802_13755, partial [Caldilineaceae bacterium]|nr:hypothetical protein [Caldilineaceae bacterium]
MTEFTGRSIALMEEIARWSDNAIQMQPRGYLYLSACSDVSSAVDAICARYAAAGPIRIHDSASNGYDPTPTGTFGEHPSGADLITHRPTIQKHFPHLSDRLTLALHPRRAGWLSAQQLGQLMLERLRAEGARLFRGSVIAIEQDGHGVSGVRIAHEDGEATLGRASWSWLRGLISRTAPVSLASNCRFAVCASRRSRFRIHKKSCRGLLRLPSIWTASMCLGMTLNRQSWPRTPANGISWTSCPAVFMFVQKARQA